MCLKCNTLQNNMQILMLNINLTVNETWYNPYFTSLRACDT